MAKKTAAPAAEEPTPDADDDLEESRPVTAPIQVARLISGLKLDFDYALGRGVEFLMRYGEHRGVDDLREAITLLGRHLSDVLSDVEG